MYAHFVQLKGAEPYEKIYGSRYKSVPVEVDEYFIPSGGLDEETAAWVDWAIKKADWVDPTVGRNDELFGEREHEKSSSKKALKEIWR